MENDSEIKLFRVYRGDIKSQPWYAYEYMTLQCFVLAKTRERAKGIAKIECPSMFEDIAKKDVFVEEVKIDSERLVTRT